jgi:hypothetical protein
MASYYRRASLVVAVDRTMRESLEDLRELGGGLVSEHSLTLVDFREKWQSCLWNSRVWTFQEARMAGNLVLTDGNLVANLLSIKAVSAYTQRITVLKYAPLLSLSISNISSGRIDAIMDAHKWGSQIIDTKTVCPCQSLQYPWFAHIAFLKHGYMTKGEMTGGQL